MPDVTGSTRKTVPFVLNFPVEFFYETVGPHVAIEELREEYPDRCAGNSPDSEHFMRVLLEYMAREVADYPEAGTLNIEKDGTVTIDRPRDDASGKFVTGEADD